MFSHAVCLFAFIYGCTPTPHVSNFVRMCSVLWVCRQASTAFLYVRRTQYTNVFKTVRKVVSCSFPLKTEEQVTIDNRADWN